MGFWEEFFNDEASGQQPSEQRDAQWAERLFSIQAALLRAGFTVEQAFEILMEEFKHTHEIMTAREVAKLRANPGN